MNSVLDSRPLLQVGLVGLLLIPFIVLINNFSPPQSKAPQGYTSTILAFEFASDESELLEVLEPLSKREVTNLDNLNYTDFGFMLAYGFFLFLFMSKFSKFRTNQLLSKSKWLAPLIVICDVLENLQLLKLSHYTTELQVDISNTLLLLGIFTWCKWLLLALTFAIIGYSLTKLTIQSKVIGILLFIPFILGIWAFISRQPITEDRFGTSIFAAFLLIFAYSIFYKK